MPSTIDGIKKVNSLSKKGWIYAGGDFDEHQNYWKIFSKSYFYKSYTPGFKSKCVCGQELTRNCWIYNPKENRIKVIGSECINKFLDKRRTCSICGDEHKNRKVNRCNKCRQGLCDNCDKKIDIKYKLCYKCKKL